MTPSIYKFPLGDPDRRWQAVELVVGDGGGRHRLTVNVELPRSIPEHLSTEEYALARLFRDLRLRYEVTE